MEPWELAYRHWRKLAERGYPKRAYTPDDMRRFDAKVRHARARYETLLAEHKARTT